MDDFSVNRDVVVDGFCGRSATLVADTSENAAIHGPMQPRGAIHRVILGPQSGSAMRTPCFVDGVEVLRSNQPFHDVARYLLGRGIAQPGDVIETWRDGMCCMRGAVNDAAYWSVSDAATGLRRTKWVPYERGGTQENADV